MNVLTNSTVDLIVVGLLYLAAAIKDAKTMTIPNTFPILLILYRTIFKNSNTISVCAKELLLTFALLFFISLIGDYFLSLRGIQRSVIGGGDIKLLSATAFVLGARYTLIMFLLSQIALLVISIIARIRSMEIIRLPLAPYLFFALIIKILGGTP